MNPPKKGHVIHKIEIEIYYNALVEYSNLQFLGTVQKFNR